MRRALEALAGSLESGEAVDRPDLAASFDELNSLMGLPEIHRLEDRYLTREQLDGRYGAAGAAPAGGDRAG